MKKIRTRVLAGGLASVALIAGVGVAIAHDGEPHPAPSGSLEGYSAERTVTVRDRASGEVVGMAMVRQRGRRLLAKITVAGLEPGSAHANHLHGEAPPGPRRGALPRAGTRPGISTTSPTWSRTRPASRTQQCAPESTSACCALAPSGWFTGMPGMRGARSRR